MFNYGSQVNPALGRSDFSGILQGQMQANQGMMQGAQAQGQAYANIGKSIAGGIDQYQKNKDEEKQMAGLIKGVQSMTDAMSPLIDKLDPRIGSSLKDLQVRLSDPGVSTREKAAMAQAFSSQLPTLLNGGIKLQEFQDQAQSRQAMEAERLAAIRAANAQKEQERMVNDAAASLARGGSVPAYLPSNIVNAAYIKAAEMTKAATQTRDELNPNTGLVEGVTSNLLTGTQTRAPKNLEAGFRPTPTGVEPIAGGAKAQEMEAKKIAEQKAVEAEARNKEELRNSFLRTLDLGSKALPLIDKGAGGPMGGSAVGKFLAGLTGASNEVLSLDRLFKTITSGELLNQIRVMREGGKTGSTGLGALNKTEGEALMNAIGNLDTSNLEKDNREALMEIMKYAAKGAGVSLDTYLPKDEQKQSPKAKSSLGAKKVETPSTSGYKVIGVRPSQ